MYGFKILCAISKCTLEISHKVLNPYTAKYALYCFLFLLVCVTTSLNCDVMSLSETGPELLKLVAKICRHPIICWNIHIHLHRFVIIPAVWHLSCSGARTIAECLKNVKPNLTGLWDWASSGQKSHEYRPKLPEQCTGVSEIIMA